MICYKAVERYFSEDGEQVEHLCGFGRCDDIDEARRIYRAGIHIVVITDAELLELRS